MATQYHAMSVYMMVHFCVKKLKHVIRSVEIMEIGDKMKEHPLIYQAWSIPLLLDGTKTQTRRVPVERYRNWQVGDRIWVRETWWKNSSEILNRVKVLYDCEIDEWECDKLNKMGWKKKPSIHMPRWACRIILEIIGLREEHIQDISREDALAEGVENYNLEFDGRVYKAVGLSLRTRFHALWDSINKKRGYGWVANPIVKVIEFRLENHNEHM